MGLIYMRARYYSPDMRRFVNADIVAGSPTINMIDAFNRHSIDTIIDLLEQ